MTENIINHPCGIQRKLKMLIRMSNEMYGPNVSSFYVCLRCYRNETKRQTICLPIFLSVFRNSLYAESVSILFVFKQEEFLRKIQEREEGVSVRDCPRGDEEENPVVIRLKRSPVFEADGHSLLFQPETMKAYIC